MVVAGFGNGAAVVVNIAARPARRAGPRCAAARSRVLMSANYAVLGARLGRWPGRSRTPSARAGCTRGRGASRLARRAASLARGAAASARLAPGSAAGRPPRAVPPVSRARLDARGARRRASARATRARSRGRSRSSRTATRSRTSSSATLYPDTGRAYAVGITGPPGVGKSSLVSALVRHVRARGQTVGVISVDPSSPFTQGALLGDRIRLAEHFLDPGVFIRSMGTRGHLGGLAEATLQALLVLDAAGQGRRLPRDGRHRPERGRGDRRSPTRSCSC